MKIKSIITSIFLFLFVCLVSTPDVGAQQTYGTMATTDTIIDAGTVNLTYKTWSGYTSGSFQVVNTKVSGTVAGKTYFEACNDGVNYITLDSLTNLNQTTNKKVFEDIPPAYLYYRFRSVGTGTMKAISKGTYCMKKP